MVTVLYFTKILKTFYTHEVILRCWQCWCKKIAAKYTSLGSESPWKFCVEVVYDSFEKRGEETVCALIVSTAVD